VAVAAYAVVGAARAQNARGTIITTKMMAVIDNFSRLGVVGH
jgi:hypothetical protein